MYAILNADEFPNFFLFFHIKSMSFLGWKALCIVIIFQVLLFIFRSSFPVKFKNGPEYFTREPHPVLFPLMRFLSAGFVFEMLPCSSEELFTYFFFHCCLCDSVRWQHCKVIVIFVFSFPTFHCERDEFFAKFHFYIKAVYSYCYFKGLQYFFSFIADSLISFMYIKWL